MESEEETFRGILRKLKKTMVDKDKTKEKIKEIINTDFLKIAIESQDEEFKKLKKGASNEIKAALKNRRKLYVFLFSIEEAKDDIQKWLNSDKDRHRNDLKGILRKFRSILDNSCLSPTPFWKRILTRGICDYIASLTDQEAINEYEKLYAGVMELV